MLMMDEREREGEEGKAMSHLQHDITVSPNQRHTAITTLTHTHTHTLTMETVTIRDRTHTDSSDSTSTTTTDLLHHPYPIASPL